MERVGSVDSNVLTPSFQSPVTSWRNSMLLEGLSPTREERKSMAVYQEDVEKKLALNYVKKFRKSSLIYELSWDFKSEEMKALQESTSHELDDLSESAYLRRMHKIKRINEG